MSVLVAVMAVGMIWRLARLLVIDDIAEPVRDRLGVILPAALVPALDCVWCASVWIGFPVAGLAWVAGGEWWFQVPAVALSGSAVAGWMSVREPIH